jgi:hypothetical protein
MQITFSTSKKALLQQLVQGQKALKNPLEQTKHNFPVGFHHKYR